MRINVGSRFDHEFADNQENTRFCDINHPDYDHDLCLDFQGHQTLRINKFIIHKNYKRVQGVVYNDIALIQLKPTNSDGECAVRGSTVQYACLTPDNDKFQTGEVCEVSGWGDTDPSSDRVFHFANQLQSGNVSLHDFDDCAEKYAKSEHLKLFEEKVHLCAYDEKVDAFIGDSGGPLVCFDGHSHAYLTGIVSFGDEVKTERPGVYVPVSRYYKWITQTIAHQEIPKFSKHNSCKDALCFY